jgi:hypothetical protein
VGVEEPYEEKCPSDHYFKRKKKWKILKINKKNSKAPKIKKSRELMTYPSILSSIVALY